MENMIGSMFSGICKLYTKFCDPIHGKRMSDDLFIKHKKEDDYLEKNHEAILQLVEAHPLEVLRSMNSAEIDQLAKKFADLFTISICNYPLEDKFDREVYLVERKISKSDYPLARTFRKQFHRHIKDMRYGDIRCERDIDMKMFISLLYRPL
jgi:hypothetical protein